MEPTSESAAALTEDLKRAGLVGDGVSNKVRQVVETMTKYPKLLGDLSIFTLECINFVAQSKLAAVPTSTPFSSLSLASPTDWERVHYYYGISPDPPELLYRSNFATDPFTPPIGRFSDLPNKTAHGVFGTPLNAAWGTVGPQIRDCLKARNVQYSAINTARFSTRCVGGGKEEFGPIVLWIATHPGTTTAETARDVSPDLLALLAACGVDSVVVEWYEGAVEKLIGPPLLPVVRDTDPTFYIRHVFTTALGMPIATKEREDDDAQGSVTLFFHENKRKDGNPSARVLGVSNCHVLRKNTGVDYEFKGPGAPPQLVRVAGKRRFQRALDETRTCIGRLGTDAEVLAREIAELEEELEGAASADAADIEADKEEKQARLDKIKTDIGTFETFYHHLTSQWSDIVRRNIGRVDWAPKIAVDDDQSLCYTFDLATFELDETRFKPHFKGNVVDLGAKYTPGELTDKFYPHTNVHKPVFKFPTNRQLRIDGCVPRELLANPDGFDGNGEPCLVVMKYGNTTDLTVGRCTGLEAYLCDERGQESTELAIYNYDRESGPFAARGDSGSLVFDGLGRMVGVIHSALPHVTFATPAWWAIEKLRAKYPHADFDRQSF